MISDKVIFSRQLAAMLNAGIPITRALYTLNNPNSTLGKSWRI